MAENGTDIKHLQIVIESSVASAKRSLTSLQKSIKQLDDSLNLSNISRFQSGIEGIATAIRQLSNGDVRKLERVATAVERISNAKSAAREVKKQAEAAQKAIMGEAQSASRTTTGPAAGLANPQKQATEAKKRFQEAKKEQTTWSKLLASVKRIAFYRILRTLLKQLSQSFRQGLQYFTLWDVRMKGFEKSEAWKTLSSYKAMGYEITASLGAAGSSLLTAIEPIILALSDSLVWLIEKFQIIIQLLRGQDTYYKVNTKAVKEYAQKVRDLKTTLLGFDELNVIQASLEQSDLYTETAITAEDKLAAEAVAGVALGSALAGLTSKVLSLTSAMKGKNQTLADQTDLTGKETGKVLAWSSALAGVGAGVGLLGGKLKDLRDQFSKSPVTAAVDTEALDDNLAYSSDALKRFGEDFDKLKAKLQKGIEAGKINEVSLADNYYELYALMDEFEANWASFSEAISTGLAISPNSFSTLKDQLTTIRNIIYEITGQSVPGGSTTPKTHPDSSDFRENRVTPTPDPIQEFAKKYFDTPSNIAKKFAEWGKDWWGAIKGAFGFGGAGSLLPVPAFASGGFVGAGQLFLANERGPELVGNIGGTTAVANQEQIVEAVSDGVYNAVVTAMSQTEGKQPIQVYLDGKQLAGAVERRQRYRGANILGGVVYAE